MFHKHCNALIDELRSQVQHLRVDLADARRDLKEAAEEAREREAALLERLTSVARPAPPPIYVQAAPDMAGGLKVDENLPPEFFDPDHALFVGKDIMPEGWVPPHLRTGAGGKHPGKYQPPRTAAGRKLQAEKEAREQAAEAAEPKES
jgi:hypothetical protein